MKVTHSKLGTSFTLPPRTAGKLLAILDTYVHFTPQHRQTSEGVALAVDMIEALHAGPADVAPASAAG